MHFRFKQDSAQLCTIHLCTIVAEDEGTLTSPYIVDLGAYSWSAECGAHTISLSAEYEFVFQRGEILSQRSTPAHDVLWATHRIQHSTRPPDVGGLLINFVSLPERHVDQELDSVRVTACTHHFTWERLHACDQELVEPWEVALLSDNGRPEWYELLQEGEGLFRGKVQWKGDGDTDSNSNTFENGASEMDNDRRKDEGVGHNVDISNDEKPDDRRPEENPSDEQDGERELTPPTDRNPWSLSIILFMTSSVLIIATRLFYARLRGLSSRLKSNRFRVYETILLRWACEGTNFDDEEEGATVNGSGGLITGEEILLKPSPRKNFVIQYGGGIHINTFWNLHHIQESHGSYQQHIYGLDRALENLVHLTRIGAFSHLFSVGTEDVSVIVSGWGGGWHPTLSSARLTPTLHTIPEDHTSSYTVQSFVK
ncbi:hypothetical protein EV702DRAFT_1049608 [Suillus placidus]|uniref:Uncharacterized protein n=1 Tax=Suillus placidus TaxID=48579 RepID=A0A9P7CY61_9AGAM|nr:hypothetical protein EV702DRAFT_1049608 [Suillus placidus]